MNMPTNGVHHPPAPVEDPHDDSQASVQVTPDATRQLRESINLDDVEPLFTKPRKASSMPRNASGE